MNQALTPRATRRLRCAVCNETWNESIIDHGTHIERKIDLTPAQKEKQEWYLTHAVWHQQVADHERIN